ncbi:PREDICTED: mediator of RNA polymerase II transcription subunit 33B isoform X2 [Tarenaya hassleriana]|uniref:mediator of RNA polymerase II transcription subunit 33B isoform X2 n=1 Tax=Tarenaya hassleriana TaxID=28532 RepID=UPI00053C3C67|nr:PREDICTED: mediator of RNA polymerase II transcription subunit 33B isoform X2 [Tarenaya hassleriana]
MAVTSEPPANGLWDSVVVLTKSAQEKNADPLHWAVQLASTAAAAGVCLPSGTLAQLLVSHFFSDNHTPIAWKLLEKAMTVKIVPPLLVLALLSPRIIPNRKLHPAAYRLYMELLKRHAFSLTSQIDGPEYQKTMKSIDGILHLSEIFGVQKQEPGNLLLEFVFSIVWQLVDASLDDEGLLELTSEKRSKWPCGPDNMEMDELDNSRMRLENHNILEKANTGMAIELIQDFLQDKVTSRIFYLASQNMPSHWEDFSHRLRVLATESVAVRNSNHMAPEALIQLTSDTSKLLSRDFKMMPQREFHAAVSHGSNLVITCPCPGTSESAIWLPIDLFLQDIMDGSQVAAASAVENLTGLVKALQAANSTTWHDAFLALWIAALRLVQREREPSEGPVPRIDTFLCVLLSVTPLAVANIIEEEESQWIYQSASSPGDKRKEKQGKCRKGLVTSLQQLGVTNDNGCYENTSMNELPCGCSGNLSHLIVEACISRNLLDTSSYLWPGYVNGITNQVPQSLVGNTSCWSLLMKGSPLTPSLTNALNGTPASSLAEIEKIYEIATTGSEDEKIAAASILCGASLVRGWNIQEHVIVFIVSLLSPPAPADHSGSYSHLVGYARFLNVLLLEISPVDCVQIFSLHGMVPWLAGALMPICEAFGSSIPDITWALPTGEEFSSHAVFSNAFTLLLRLWRFDHPPLDHVIGDVPPVGSQSSPEYLLLVRNCFLASFGKSAKDQMARKRFSKAITLSLEPIFMDLFPRLKQWYRQHQECIASILSGLTKGSPVHHIVDALLSMMFKKANKGSGQSLTPPSSGSSSVSAASTAEDTCDQLKLPAWDILEATPFVLDAALTACAHGTLSPRELATGLKILADFLPATLGTIVSYFSAEVTRGLWKPASMNGTDWPSPAANLASVEQQIKKILAATGVDIPRLPVDGSSPAMLPLPLAALVSLTITYKLDKASDRFLVLVGPALDSLAAACPWPCMPIVVSLWAQKVKRWSDYLVFSASRTVFHHNSDAVVQLLRSCFTSTLGLTPASQISSRGGVGALLGHGFRSLYSGGISAAAPGILYIKVHRAIRDVIFMTEEILSLLMFSVKNIASSELSIEKAERLKRSKHGTRYGQVTLSSAMRRVKLAASLGASLVWMSGGLNLVQALIKETLPSWFISGQGSEGEVGGMVPVLRGYALAYFAILCSAFAWGVDSSTPASKRRPRVLRLHLEFLVSALDGKISLGCDCATWQAYVTGFVSLMVSCVPAWVLEMDVEVVKRLSKGLRQWKEEELALSLLSAGGVGTMGAATELIVQTFHKL